MNQKACRDASTKSAPKSCREGLREHLSQSSRVPFRPQPTAEVGTRRRWMLGQLDLRSRAYDNGNYVRAPLCGAACEGIIFRYQMTVRTVPMMLTDNIETTNQYRAKGMKCRSTIGYHNHVDQRHFFEWFSVPRGCGTRHRSALVTEH